LGNSIFLHILNDIDGKNIVKIFFVAPASKLCNIPEIKEFFPYPTFKLKTKSHLIVSTNDNYMHTEEALTLQKELGSTVKIIKNGGHINEESGFGKFTYLLDEIVAS
jgi:predicted alpha/beta hydrolase family esterase